MEDFNLLSYFTDFTNLFSNDDKKFQIFLTLKMSRVYKTSDYTIPLFATNQ